MKPTKKRIAVLLCLVVLGIAWYAFKSGYFNSTSGPGSNLSQIKVGGPFELTNQYGEIVHASDFHGRYMLVFFGFTYCPDICPTTLTTISIMLDELGEFANKVMPVFVTVDPERDTPEFLKEYLQHFHPAIQGLTGTAEQIKKITKDYGIYYAKVQEDASIDSDDYMMDHTAITFLMGPDGLYKAHFSHDTTADVMAKKLLEILPPSDD